MKSVVLSAEGFNKSLVLLKGDHMKEENRDKGKNNVKNRINKSQERNIKLKWKIEMKQWMNKGIKLS